MTRFSIVVENALTSSNARSTLERFEMVHRNFNVTLEDLVRNCPKIVLVVASCILYFLTTELLSMHLSDFAKVFQKDCWS